MNTVPGFPDLDPKLQRFLDLYLTSGNAYESARKSGYTDSIARDVKRCLFTRPGAIEYIRARAEEHKRATIADAIELKERLTKVIRTQDNDDFIMNDYWFNAFDRLTKLLGLDKSIVEEAPREITFNHEFITRMVEPLPEPASDAPVETGKWASLH